MALPLPPSPSNVANPPISKNLDVQERAQKKAAEQIAAQNAAIQQQQIEYQAALQNQAMLIDKYKKGLLSEAEFNQLFAGQYNQYGKYSDTAMQYAYAQYYKNNNPNPDAQLLSSYAAGTSNLPQSIKKQIGGGSLTSYTSYGAQKNVILPTQNTSIQIGNEQIVSAYSVYGQGPVFVTASGKSFSPNLYSTPIPNYSVYTPPINYSQPLLPSGVPSTVLEKQISNYPNATFSPYQKPVQPKLYSTPSPQLLAQGQIKTTPTAPTPILPGFIPTKINIYKTESESPPIVKQFLANPKETISKANTIEQIGLGPIAAVAGISSLIGKPYETITGVLNLGGELVSQPINTIERLKAEQALAYYEAPAFYLSSLASQAIIFSPIEKTLSKLNEPSEILVTGKSTKVQTEGIAGSGKGVFVNTFTGYVQVPRFGKISEGILYKTKPITITETVYEGTSKLTPKSIPEPFEKIAKEATTSEPYLIETFGIGKKAIPEVKPQAEILQSQIEEGLVSRSVGKILTGGKELSKASTQFQKTTNISSAIIKESPYFPGGIAERQVIPERVGQVSVLSKAGKNPLPSFEKIFNPKTNISKGSGQIFTKVANPYEGVEPLVGTFKQKLSSTRVETGQFSGYEKIESFTESIFPTKGKPTLRIRETSTTFGKAGTKTNITETNIGIDLEKKIGLALEQADRFAKTKPMKPLEFKPKEIQNSSGTLTEVELGQLKQLAKSSETKPQFSIPSFPATTEEIMGVFEEPSFFHPEAYPTGASFKGFSTTKQEPVIQLKNTTLLQPKTIHSTIPILTPKTIPSIVPKTIPGIIPKTIPFLVPKTVPSTIPTTIPSTIPTTIPEIIPVTLPQTVPKTIPVTIPQTVPKTIPLTLPILDTESIIRPLSSIKAIKTDNDILKPAYRIQTKVRGKRVLIGPKLTYKDAFAYGINEVRKDVRASLKPVRVEGFAKERGLVAPKIPLYVSKEGFYVQPRGTRLTTPGEISSIQSYRKKTKEVKNNGLQTNQSKRNRIPSILRRHP